MSGNEALAESALQAGCRFYAGYPITPQNEIPEYMAKRMPEYRGVFIQAESELSAINMVFGASATGVRAMTSSSGPGISLKQEGISFLAGAELPAVIVNVQRGGPGLGNISASQGDYFQAVKGGGHGDYKLLVYAPSNLQEIWQLTMLAFDKADYYKNPVMILMDAILGQMMEPFTPTPYEPIKDLPTVKDWALTGALNRQPKVIKTLYLGDRELEGRNWQLYKKYQKWTESEVLFETYNVEASQWIIVAFGICARIASASANLLKQEGLNVGLLKPLTLVPFASQAIYDLALKGKKLIVVELNTGQMFQDVLLAVKGKTDVKFIGRPGGSLLTPEELSLMIKEIVKG